MRNMRYLVPLAVALLFSFVATAEEGKVDTRRAGGAYGTLSAAPAGADAKVLGVLKTKTKDGEKSLNVLAANDTIAATIKELVAKGATVYITKSERSADGNSITVSEIKEPRAKTGDKPK